MIQYKTIIVDDEPNAIVNLTEFIHKTQNLTLAGTYGNPLEALDILASTAAPDIAFLDIDMPELSGLALANLAGRYTQVVFVSGHPQYALDAYDLHAAGYLLKPFSFETFLDTVQHVCGILARPRSPYPSEPLLFKTSIKGKYITLLSQDIIYIEAMGNYVKIQTIGSEHPKIVYLSLKQAVAQLKETNMIRVSRSYLINTVYMEAIDGNTIVLKNNKSIDVGPTYRSDFQDYIRTRLVNA
ncbi:MAG: response regulator transcription factor [Flavobacterium sp.]|nr:MAG: response regulator transcription factor [Flavobacterium sp.]